MRIDRPIYGADDEIWKRAPELGPDIRLTVGDRIAVFIVFLATWFATLVVCFAVSMLANVTLGLGSRGEGGFVIFALLALPAIFVVPYLAVTHHVSSIRSSKARRSKYLPSTIALEPKEPSS